MNETSEIVRITDEEEEIPDIDPDELLADTILEKIESAREPAPAAPAAPVVVPVQAPAVPGGQPQYQPPFSGGQPSMPNIPNVVRLETGPIEIRQLPPGPPEEMEISFTKPSSGPVKKTRPLRMEVPEPEEDEDEDLLDYLQSLTRYLPPETSQDFRESGMADKLDHLRKVVKPRGGIEKVVREVKQKEIKRKENGQKISGTLSFIHDLTET